jgi:hypothetical protein
MHPMKEEARKSFRIGEIVSFSERSRLLFERQA